MVSPSSHCAMVYSGRVFGSMSIWGCGLAMSEPGLVVAAVGDWLWLVARHDLGEKDNYWYKWKYWSKMIEMTCHFKKSWQIIYQLNYINYLSKDEGKWTKRWRWRNHGMSIQNYFDQEEEKTMITDLSCLQRTVNVFNIQRKFRP